VVQSVITTFDQFREVLQSSVAYLVNGEVFPFAVPKPNPFQVIDQARNNPKTRIAKGERGDRIFKTLQEPNTDFINLPLKESLKTPIHISLFELGSMRESGGALAEIIQNVYLPLTELWKDNGLRWDKVYPILFSSGPNCSTNYHWDPSSVLIIQLHGRKRFHSLKSPEYWCPESVIEQKHQAMVKPTGLSEDDILIYELEPGDAIWSPCKAPHWLDAYDETAFTLSIAFTNISDDTSTPAKMEIL
tara:strand:- start:1089 stop:1826 length:738 start_codon:yes stop_codon:yes gene_type:complete